MDTRYFVLEEGRPALASKEQYDAWVAGGGLEEYRLENEIARADHTYIVVTSFDGLVDADKAPELLPLFHTRFILEDAGGRQQPQDVDYTWPTFGTATDMHHKIVDILTSNPAATPAAIVVS